MVMCMFLSKLFLRATVLRLLLLKDSTWVLRHFCSSWVRHPEMWWPEHDTCPCQHQVGTKMGQYGCDTFPTTPQGPRSILLALVCVLCAKAVSWDVSLVHVSLYVFINKTIKKRGSEMLCGIQCWFLHFSTAWPEPVSTLLLISQAASRMPLLSQYLHTFLYCIVFLPCQCIFYLYNCFFTWIQYVCLNDSRSGILVYFHITPSITGRRRWHNVTFVLSKTKLVLLFCCVLFSTFPFGLRKLRFHRPNLLS